MTQIEPQLEYLLKSNALFGARYRLLRALGSGATGLVVLAEDTHSNKSRLALKLLYPHLVLDEAAFARFRAESALMMRLSHPNVLPTYGMGYDERGIHFQKMFFSEGISLREWLESEQGASASEELRLGLLLQVALGLAHAHGKGVIHRDVKPENALLSVEAEVRVTDFGLSQLIRQEARLTARGQLLGTPNYMAPEQIRGELLDPRSDVYSFGLTAYELITGRRAFEAQTFFELAELHLHQTVPRLGLNYSTEVDGLLQRCTAKRRDERPSSMIEVAVQLATLLGQGEALELDTVEFPRAEVDAAQPSRFQPRSIVRAILLVLAAVTLLSPFYFSTIHWRLNSLVILIERGIGSTLPLVHEFYGLAFTFRDEGLIFSAERYKPDVHILLASGADVNQLDPLSGMRPLHYWSMRGDLGAIRAMVKMGAEINLLDRMGATPLHYAIANNRREVASYLLREGVRTNVEDSGGKTPLLIAVEARVHMVVDELLNYAADPLQKNRNGVSPLSQACLLGDDLLIQTLARKGYRCELLTNG